VTFSVLFVCTGNVCRSPMAELLARAALDGALGADSRQFRVSSAGTWGHDGSPMEAEAVEALGSLGIDGRSFRARELTRGMLADADLILAVAREHTLAAVAAEPGAGERVFLLSEFARIVSSLPPAPRPGGEVTPDAVATARALVAAAGAARGPDPVLAPGDADLADPYGAPLHVFLQSARRIQELLQPMISRVTGHVQPAATRSPCAGVGMAPP
jgi:protein-tyrosine phosphatase